MAQMRGKQVSAAAVCPWNPGAPKAMPGPGPYSPP